MKKTTPNIIEGKAKAGTERYGIVVSRFNEFITQRLLDGCLDELRRCGVSSDRVTVVWVPGAFEIPLVALRMAKKRSIAAVIALGAVIRGETAHFDLVARESAWGVQEVALTTGKPVIFGVLATDTVGQASARSEEDGDNKGRDAARSAVEMVGVLRRMTRPFPKQ